jgi:hypothetical protein
VVIAPHFGVAYSFSQGLAVVSIKGKTGFIDHLGRWVSPPYSGEPDFLSDGFVAIADERNGKTGDQWGYMGPDGKFIWRASMTEAPTHELWPFFGFDETQKQKEIERSCQTNPV